MKYVALFLLFVLSFEAVATEPESVCYGDLGCFSTDEPWSSFGRRAVLPDSPEIIGTRFLLYTKQGDAKTPEQLIAGDVGKLRSSHYDNLKPVKFIAHGYASAGWKPWVKHMAAQLLKVEDANVIVVDWEKGSKGLYAHAAANIRVVAAQIRQLLTFLTVQAGLKLENVHFIGHSLGAHMAGYVGAELRGLGRITGLDPAGPFFEKMDPLIRLDETDANFVDALHTDGNSIFHQLALEGGLGIWTPSAHVDVYVNGGLKQPGCGEVDPITVILDEGFKNGTKHLFYCNHGRSHDLLSDLITATCPFRSYSCPNWQEFMTGRCLHCPVGDDKTCNSVGLKATKPSDGSFNNVMWMSTGAKEPFCRYHYHVQLTNANIENRDMKAKVWFNLIGNKGRSGFILVNNSGEDKDHLDRFIFKPGSVFDFLVLSPVDLGDTITAVEFKWRYDASLAGIKEWLLGTPKIYPMKVKVFSGEYQTTSSFCDNKKPTEPLETLHSRLFSENC